MEERLLLDGVALHSGNIAPGNVESAPRLKRTLQTPGWPSESDSSVRSIATNAIAIQLFPKTGVALADALTGVRMSPKVATASFYGCEMEEGRALFRSGFRLEAMSTIHPSASWRARRLARRHLRREAFDSRFAHLVALCHRDRRPEVGSRQIGGDAATSQ